KKVKTLSGGERARLAICKLVSGEHNFLILDEVTNHLDLDSRHAVELALAEYNGSILAASHDRFFLDSFVTKIAYIKENKIFNYHGNFTEFWSAEKKMRSLLQKGELKKFIVRKKYTDWTTGIKYTQGTILELSELDLGGHKDAVKNGWLVPLKKR
ncbi:MAG: ATP-binding cassette domain-containing protein, partial [Thermoplasmata archaeon]